jgi:hypothetical protein
MASTHSVLQGSRYHSKHRSRLLLMLCTCSCFARLQLLIVGDGRQDTNVSPVFEGKRMMSALRIILIRWIQALLGHCALACRSWDSHAVSRLACVISTQRGFALRYILSYIPFVVGLRRFLEVHLLRYKVRQLWNHLSSLQMLLADLDSATIWQPRYRHLIRRMHRNQHRHLQTARKAPPNRCVEI